MNTPQVEFVDVDGTNIAVRRQEGDAPGVMWLGGYKSDMLGTKAEALAEWATGQGRAFLRHDYSGHGESGGEFADGTISKWLRESLAVFARHTRGPQVLVGSSMGGWIALRMVQELLQAGESRVRGLVLIAPAPDFTAELVEPAMTDEQRRELAEQGYFEIPSDYVDEPYIYTRNLIEDGRANLMMSAPIDTHCPVHILQGMQDESVPHSHALKLVSLLPADDVTLSLVPDGDHRLSRPQDIELLISAVRDMAAQASRQNT
ncbi:pimeloyl-ACP methyl ester carboxylesterase [Aquamicrobium lusatiense]|uniref:Pimeloyl-ACP methyl ester carboxylesterase n=1 Tax=Aquamicrobium lusatiense TaxID=89772 RepID=A0A7W9S0B2_9HYPH|nr:alpha/beta hydrolase [Aquamicrobium lusatiense]MBB6011604.1 pimeloyl-ACP methyl ester carboxylesterase [Aquamicrobium lusatiense]